MEIQHVLNGGIFTVERATWSLEGGEGVERFIVRHPGAVTIVPVLDDGRVVLVRNARIAVDARLWELPAGKLEPNESPVDTARRELSEETGYTCAHLVPLGTFFTSPGFCDEVMHCFLAEGLHAGDAHPEPGEDLIVEVVEPDRLWSMVDDGTLIDGKTMAALLLWQRRSAKIPSAGARP